MNRGQGSGPEIVVLDDAEAVAKEAARRVRRSAAIALLGRGAWRISLAGGSTPRGLYRLLAEEHVPAERIDWSRTNLYFGDERAVPPDHADSNFGMVRDVLLAQVPIPAANVHRMRGEAGDLDKAAADYEAQLERIPRLDLAIMGMGPDGHTASLFPGTAALEERQRLCVAVEVPQLATRRITLTHPVFEAAREVIFLIAGGDKAHTLHRVIEGPERAGELPCQPVIRRRGPVTILCDRSAAAELSTEAIASPTPRDP
jgi:6-phosphogluconolactonase